MREGTVPFLDGAETWYRVTGELSEVGPAPLVVLHGGPGMAHDDIATHGTNSRIAAVIPIS